MSYDYAGGSPFKVVTLSFWAGLIEILAGFLNLGFFIQFISKPVLAAFSNVVAIKVIEKPSILLLKLYHSFFKGCHSMRERIFWVENSRQTIHNSMEGPI